MLILTRKLGESFFIGDDIQVAVLAIKKWQVDLGVIAPRNVLIYRKEIYDAIKQQGVVANLDYHDDGA